MEVRVLSVGSSFLQDDIWLLLDVGLLVIAGFMTFMPEWLSGSPNLDTSNFMYKYVVARY